jgi:hypothetical protein
LEKGQINKPTCKEVIAKILLQALVGARNEPSSQLFTLQEITKRVASKNLKLASFTTQLLITALQDHALNLDSAHLKQVFKQIAPVCSHSHKEVRELALKLLGQIYVQIEEDADTLIKNLGELRPL